LETETIGSNEEKYFQVRVHLPAEEKVGLLGFLGIMWICFHGMHIKHQELILSRLKPSKTSIHPETLRRYNN